MDIDLEKVRLATEDALQNGLAARLLYCVEDGARLPFTDNSSEVAISCNALHHIAVPLREQFVDELAHVASETVIIADMGDERFAWIHAEGDHTQVLMPAGVQHTRPTQRHGNISLTLTGSENGGRS